ncbi:MAG: hypothetical protein GXY85_12150 [Candidatus Brocadiaceae bacterium]|nr:hypothetical protein [Candidatus Brocadiaceae bacterium]
MIIEIFGKQNCALCESAKKKIAHFLKQWDQTDKVQVVFQDMETIDGAAQGDYFDVFDIPSVLLKDKDDQVIARWDGQAPPSDELQKRLSA